MESITITKGLTGGKIQAIKALRFLTGAGLRECKDAVDGIWPALMEDERNAARNDLLVALQRATRAGLSDFEIADTLGKDFVVRR